MARGALAAGLPGELPVMGALVESSLTNLPQADRDTAGYFQTRVAVWNKPPYQDFPQHPELQLQWFVDLATQARRADLARGFDPLGGGAVGGHWAREGVVPRRPLPGALSAGAGRGGGAHRPCIPGGRARRRPTAGARTGRHDRPPRP